MKAQKCMIIVHNPYNDASMIRNSYFAIVALLSVVLLFALWPLNASAKESKKILVMPSYNVNYLGSQWFLQGTFEEFKEHAPFEVVYYYENLQLAARPSDEKYFLMMAEALKIKYTNEKPDLIIVHYKQALEFINRYCQTFFAGIPVVVAGLELENYETIVLPSNVTGVTGSFDAIRNIELILQNHPKTRTIYIVAGVSSSERDMVQLALRQGQLYKERVAFVVLNEEPFETLLKKIGELEEPSAIMYFSMQIDSAGQILVPAEAAVKIGERANVPVYGMLDTYMGSGIVGGFLINHKQMGRRAAQIGMEILTNARVVKPLIANEPLGAYRFDWRQLKRWNIDERQLPDGSEIEYLEISLWNQYGRQIMAGIALLLLQGGGIALLLLQRRKRKQAQLALEKSEKRLRESHQELMAAYKDVAASEEELRNLYGRLSFISLHDVLTGVYNRTFFEEESRQLATKNVLRLGIFVCDVDGLKLINDTLGHRKGDKLLKKAASILNEKVTRPNFTARIGGDEFVVLLFDVTEQEMIARQEEYAAAIKSYNANNQQLPLSLSIGWAIAGENCNVDCIFKEADHNMYRQKMHQQQSSRNALVQIMMKALEARDHVTEEHAERLGILMEKMGSWLHLSQATVADLRLFAKFHDIGKVGIPDDVLNKPGRLTEEEMTVMRRHCEIGHRIAKASPDLEPIADLVLKHQERWDGGGYPLGLRGAEIPIECRIMAIIDAYDAMTSDRPYRSAMTMEAAIAEIRRCAGTQFDPILAEKFIELLNNEMGR